MIELKNINKSFDQNKVYQQFSFKLETSKCHGIVGLNGSGKSTLFNLISTYIKPENGEIYFNGNNISRDDVLYLETNNYFYPYLSGQEYLNIFTNSNSEFKLEELNSIFQLPLNNLIEDYSTGMKKKLALMAILKQDRPIYIFDEPFNGLDLESNHVVELIIKKLMDKGKTILISSHILKPLEFLCNQFHYLENGKIINSYGRDHYSALEDYIANNINNRFETLINQSL